MSGGKQTPRQKMINMMYLVLTALLAMNVQKEVLLAFMLINQGLRNTTENFAKKNETTYQIFVKAAAESPEKHGKWKAKAFEVKGRTENMIRFIDDLKVQMIMKADKLESEKEVDEDKIESLDNKETSEEFMVFHGRGEKLRDEINQYKSFLTNYIKPKDVEHKAAIMKSLNTDDPVKEKDESIDTWVTKRFEALPFIAVITSLSQIQSEVRHAEAEIIAYLQSEIDAGAIPVNKIDAIVLPEKTYILKGDSFRADIFLAGSDTMNNPVMHLAEKVDAVGSGEYSMSGKIDSLAVIHGKGKVRIKTFKTGVEKFSGLVKLKTPGGLKYYPFNSEYEVGEPSINVSPDKMNVFYIGVDNPVTISATGYPANRTKPSILGGGGSLSLDSKSGEGKYIVRVNTAGTCKINVRVEDEVGKSGKDMGSKEFRVKNVPPPIAYYMGKQLSSKITIGELSSGDVVIAKLDNFDFDVRYTVTKFKVSVNLGGVFYDESVNGNKITEKVKGMFAKVKKGSKVLIEEVYSALPGRPPVPTPGITLTIN